MTTVRRPDDPKHEQPASPEYGPEVHEELPDSDEEKVTIPTRNVRQGVAHHNVRIVLAVSLSAVVALMVLAYFVFF